jgi:hypothetical protein
MLKKTFPEMYFSDVKPKKKVVASSRIGVAMARPCSADGWCEADYPT